MTTNEYVNVLISASSLAVAGASFFVSWLSFSRDSGRLDVSVSLGHIWGGAPLQQEQRIIYIQAVNSGRRPVMLSSFGGDTRFHRLKKIAKSLRLPLVPEPKSWLFMNSPLIDAQFRPNGQPRVLQEGESVIVTIPYDGNQEVARQLASSSRLYVFDSMSRKHRVRRGNLRRLRKDAKDWNAGRE